MHSMGMHVYVHGLRMLLYLRFYIVAVVLVCLGVSDSVFVKDLYYFALTFCHG